MRKAVCLVFWKESDLWVLNMLRRGNRSPNSFDYILVGVVFYNQKMYKNLRYS